MWIAWTGSSLAPQLQLVVQELLSELTNKWLDYLFERSIASKGAVDETKEASCNLQIKNYQLDHLQQVVQSSCN